MITVKKSAINLEKQGRLRKQRIRALAASFVEMLVGTLVIGAMWAMFLFALLSPCGATIVDAHGNRTVHQCSLWSE